MNSLQTLKESAQNVERLERFISTNSIELNDYFISQSYSNVSQNQEELSNFILQKFKVIQSLNYRSNKNSSFLFCLLDFAERFGLQTEFQQLFTLTKSKNVDVGLRLNAASKFLIGIRKLNDYIIRIDSILEELRSSYLTEEDSSEKVICTIVHYYSEVFNNFGRDNKAGVFKFREELVLKLSQKENECLFPEYLKDILELSIENIDELYIYVHNQIDSILDRRSINIEFNEDANLIESNTNYAEALIKINPNFSEIKNLCTALYSTVSDQRIFNSLQRGVSILSEENQLLAYLSSYGNMHQAKLTAAFNHIPTFDENRKYELIDWGCGQGIASICFLEKFVNLNNSNSIEQTTLIEPSEIALKRAALHLNKFIDNHEVNTINKTLDAILPTDLQIKTDCFKIQLFSNILDIDFYNLRQLVELIKNNFEGTNLFVIVSPYISDQKTQRIDDFVESFISLQDYKLISSVSERKGEWTGTNWSRIIRIFSVEL